MSLTIPPSVNFKDPMVMLPSRSQDEPREGRYQIAAEIKWTDYLKTYAGVNVYCIAIDAQKASTKPISQISALKVDNSRCDSVLSIIFPDTSEVITIPARAPVNVVPVYSNSTSFYVYAIDFTSRAPVAADVTRLQILNYAVNPTSVDLSNNIGQLVPMTIGPSRPATMNNSVILTNKVADGILDNWFMKVRPDPLNAPPPNPYEAIFTLQDGTGKTLITGGMSSTAAYPLLNGYVIADFSGLDVRFSQGINLLADDFATWPAGLFFFDFLIKWRTTS